MKKKIVAMCATVAIAAVAVGGTLAYFTDTDAAENTFTVGKISIVLDEAPVDDNGQATAGERVKKNEYKLFPGGEYSKDPMVTVEADSEECYVRMLVTADVAALKAAFPQENYKDFYAADGTFLLQNLVRGWDGEIWECDNVNGNVYEFRYYETVDTLDGNNLELKPLFTSVVIPSDVEDETLVSLNDAKINIVAQAIQADGFNGADEAWGAWPIN